MERPSKSDVWVLVTVHYKDEPVWCCTKCNIIQWNYKDHEDHFEEKHKGKDNGIKSK